MTWWARGPEFRRAVRRKRAELHHCAPVPPGFPGMTIQGGIPARDSQPVRLPPRSLVGSRKWAGHARSVVWSGTEYASNPNNAWNFNTNNGNQNANNKNNNNYAWAVLPGE